MKENLFVDLTWLKGKVRAVVSAAIQQKAIESGYHWLSTDGVIQGNIDGYLVLRNDKTIESWHDEHKPTPEIYRDLCELSVNDALDGNYDKVKMQKPVVKAGDVVFSRGRFQIVEDTRNYDDGNVYVEIKGAWTCNYKLCREKKYFKFHEGQRIYRPEANAYYTFLRYVSTTAECYSCQHELVNVDISKFVPAALKERYEVIK